MTKLLFVTTYQPENDARLEQAIASNYPGDHYAIGRGQWMITAEATAAQVAEALGILAGQSPLSGSYVICTSEYAGRAKNEMGEWMDAKAPRRAQYSKTPFNSRQPGQPFFWQAKRLVTDLLILTLFALMSFLALYVLSRIKHVR